MAEADSFDEYAEILRRRVRDLQPALEQTMAIVGQDMVSKAKEHLMDGSLKAPTGNLAGSINSRIEVSGTEITTVVGTVTEYAPYVEYGTGSKGDATALGSGAFTTRESWVYTPDNGLTFKMGYPVAPRPYLRPAYYFARDGQLEVRIREMLAQVFA